MFRLILNLWTYWSCIKKGKYTKRISDYIEWNLCFIERRWLDHYVPFHIMYEKIKKQDELFRPGYLSELHEKYYGHFLQSIEY